MSVPAVYIKPHDVVIPGKKAFLQENIQIFQTIWYRLSETLNTKSLKLEHFNRKTYPLTDPFLPGIFESNSGERYLS